jgi:purine-binding chemotaxis protein CheW
MEEQEKNVQTFLTFRLGNEKFAATLDKALNILEVMPITKVPQSPVYMKGVINRRGEIIPIIDIRMKFGMEPLEYTKRTVIIIFRVEIQGESADVGALVDEPGTVIEVADSEITPPPSIGAKYKSELVKGMLKVDNDFIMVLEIDKVFSLDELVEINQNRESVQKDVSN